MRTITGAVFLNALCARGIFPLSDIKIVPWKRDDLTGYMYLDMKFDSGISLTELENELKTFKEMISNKVLQYTISFREINNIQEHGVHEEYYKRYERILGGNIKLVERPKYSWDYLPPVLFMRELLLDENETYIVDFEKELVIVTRILDDSSFQEEGLKIEKSNENDNLYKYRGTTFESERSLHELRLEVGYDDSKDSEI